MNTKPLVALTIPELKSLLQTAKNVRDERFYLMTLIAASHGLRVSEVIALRRKNFTMAGDDIYLTVARLKGSLKTTQKVSRNDDPLLDENTALTKYIAGMKPNECLFKNEDGKPLTRFGANFLFKRIAEWAGLPVQKRHCHSLKHCLGQAMRDAGARLEEIQTALGHKSINSTAQYLRVTEERADVVRAGAFNTQAMAAAAGGD